MQVQNGSRQFDLNVLCMQNVEVLGSLASMPGSSETIGIPCQKQLLGIGWITVVLSQG